MAGHVRRVPLALVALALLTTAGSCRSGSSGDADTAVHRFEAAVAITRSAGTARIEQALVMEFPRGATGVAAGRLSVRAEGYVDLRGRRGRLSVTTASTGPVSADILAGDMEMILDGRALYLKSPFYQQLAPDHEPWLRLTYEELETRGLSQLGQQDPTAFILSLRGLDGGVEEVGTSEVRGEPATHYRATIDVERLLSQLTGEERATTAATFRQLGIDRMPAEVWLDGEGRLRRLVTDVRLGKAAAGGRMSLDLELFDFGVAFELSAPPENQVAEFGEVFGAAD